MLRLSCTAVRLSSTAFRAWQLHSHHRHRHLRARLLVARRSHLPSQAAHGLHRQLPHHRAALPPLAPPAVWLPMPQLPRPSGLALCTAASQFGVSQLLQVALSNCNLHCPRSPGRVGSLTKTPCVSVRPILRLLRTVRPAKRSPLVSDKRTWANPNASQ